MEASNIGGREADVAPADPYAGRSAGWVPANPAPLGLAGFAATTFMLSMINSNLVSHLALTGVLGLALAYGGIAQLIAGIWEFRTGNTFGAVAFTSFGAFWVSFWALITFFAPTIPPEHVGAAVGLYLISWGIFTAYMFIASLRTTGAVALVFFLLTITFILLGIGNSGGHEGITEVGGWTGLLTAAAAWYASMAAVVNSTFGKTVMPVVPLGD
jgi:succinate-acetate transporter protein